MPSDAREREAGVGEEHRDDVQREERALQERRTRACHRVERRNQVERDHQRRNEHAHRALVGGELDVEVRQTEQPHERRQRRRRADERRVADVHGLHADEERVREQAAAEDGGRQPADTRIPPREVRQIGGGGRGVENERNEVHDTTGSGPVRSSPDACAPSAPAWSPARQPGARRRCASGSSRSTRGCTDWPALRKSVRRSSAARRR